MKDRFSGNVKNINNNRVIEANIVSEVELEFAG
jgi:hypothetical protein